MVSGMVPYGNGVPDCFYSVGDKWFTFFPRSNTPSREMTLCLGQEREKHVYAFGVLYTLHISPSIGSESCGGNLFGWHESPPLWLLTNLPYS